MPAHALFPGTFDPPTLGHVDLVRRAASLFERVTVGLADHPTKDTLFDVAERLGLCEASLAGLEGVRVRRLEGLVVDACEAWGCDAIVRGVRAGTDYDYEARMAATNRTLLPRIDTVLLCATPAVAHITSTWVRQVARLGGDPGALVPEPVQRALRARFG